MFFKSLFAGLCIATSCCHAMTLPIQKITERDLWKPSLFACEVAKLNSERSRALIITPLWLGAYALWSYCRPSYESTPAGSSDLYQRIKNLFSTTQQQKARTWQDTGMNYLRFIGNLTVQSLVTRVIERTFDTNLLPHWGLAYRFPAWNTYYKKVWFTHYRRTIDGSIATKNTDALRRTTALLAETCKEIIIDVRYIVTQLLTNKNTLEQTLQNSGALLFSLTNELIDLANQPTINWDAVITKVRGLQDCMKSITVTVNQANTILTFIA